LEQRADLVIADCDGAHPRGGVAESQKLRASASPGFARKRPIALRAIRLGKVIVSIARPVLKCDGSICSSGRATMIQDTRESLQHVYREGIFTRALGRPCSSNPYRADTAENFLWEKGWRLVDATREQRALDELGLVLATNFKEHQPVGTPTCLWWVLVAVCLATAFILGATAASLIL
jgi:hypothetical protein